jgi:hypothetical protein
MTDLYNGHPDTLLNHIIPATSYLSPNTVAGFLGRATGRCYAGFVNITADTETKAINVFQITGTVLVVNQIAIITAAPALTNCTNVYASFYDGTLDQDLTADGINLSGAPVGTTFFKDKAVSQTYTLLDVSTGVVYEPSDFKQGKPFYVVQKNGADSFIRFNLTTNTTLDFTMYLEFEYVLINGATLELV